MQTGKIQADEPLNTEVQTQLPPVEEILTPEMELQKKNSMKLKKLIFQALNLKKGLKGAAENAAEGIEE